MSIFLGWMAMAPRTPEGVLEALGRKALKERGKRMPLALEIAQGLARNPRTPGRTLEVLAREFGREVYPYVALNPKAPGELLRRLLEEGEERVLGNPSLPKDLWEGYRQEDPGEHPWILAHPETPLDHGEWWRLPGKGKEEALLALLHNPRAREAKGEVLGRLLEGVRGKEAALQAPYAPLAVRLEAAKGVEAIPYRVLEALRATPIGERLELIRGWLEVEGELAGYLQEVYKLLALPLEEFWRLPLSTTDGLAWTWGDLAPLRAEEGPLPVEELLEDEAKREFALLEPLPPLDLFLLLLEDEEEYIRKEAREHPLAELLEGIWE